MTDAEALTLKAFLAALSQQQQPLSDTVNAQLREIAQSLDTHVLELHDIALATPALTNHYKNARLWLTSTAAERGKGLKFLPADSADDDDTLETDNTTRDTRSTTENLKQVLQAIDANFQQAPKILGSPDPVTEARQSFNQR